MVDRRGGSEFCENEARPDQVKSQVRGDRAPETDAKWWAKGVDLTLTKIKKVKPGQKSGARRWFLDSHHVTGYRLSGMRCRALGYFDHFTLTAEQLALTRRKLAKGSPFKAVQRKRVLYEQVQEFMDKFAAPHGDATQHKWCRGPPRRAVQNVTILQQTHLDYCGLRRLVGDRKAK